MKDLKDYGIFELAGYTEEESNKLIEICDKQDIEHNKMLAFLKSFVK